MGHRNMRHSSLMTDLDPDQQGQSNLPSEPCVLMGSVTNFPQPNIHMMLPAAGNPANFDFHHLPGTHENALFYGTSQYGGFQLHHPAINLDLGVGTTSNYCHPFVHPSGSRLFPLPANQASNDGVRCPVKRKNEEGIPGSFQHSNASAGSSSAIAPSNTRPSQPGVTLMDAPSFPVPEYRGNLPSVTELGSRRGPWNGSGIGPVAMSARNASHLIHANYPDQAFQTASSPLLDQQFSSNTWSQAPAIAYLHGSSSNVNSGCMVAGNMGAQGFQETSNGSSTAFLCFPPIFQGHPNLHHLPQPMQRVRAQNINFLSQVATLPRRVSTNSSSNTSIYPNGMEVGPRFAGPVPPTGLRMYRPHQRALLPEAIMRHHDLPHLRFLPADEVAMLEISGYYEVASSIDHHRDLRLDVDHMSYEELLALGEQIGSVATGLSEETVSSHLKSRTYISSATSMNLEEAPCDDRETDFCVICQTDYKKQEKIGTLDCGHDYHIDCVKRWLLIKNSCPICKSPALADA